MNHEPGFHLSCDEHLSKGWGPPLQIAQLLRTGVVTQCQLLPANYMQLRRAWGEYHRLRRERARLKTLLVHQLYGVFPELVGEWHTVTASYSSNACRSAKTCSSQ